MKFVDREYGDVDVKSTWKKEARPVEISTQTPTFATTETDVQTYISLFQKKECEEADVQTDPKPPVVPEPELDPENGEGFMKFSGVKGGDDLEAMGKFLDGVEDLVMGCIEKNVHSFAFEGYDVKWDEEIKTVEAVHTLTAPLSMYNDGDADLQTVDLAWNCTGSVVAAAYGRVDLVGWCKSPGFVCCWNVTRKDVVKPDVVFENTSYIMSIAFHPTQPSLLLGGSYTGEVLLWDLSAEVPLLGQTNLQSEQTHRDPVVKVMWVLDRLAKPTDPNRFHMVSCSGDGRILFWQRDATVKQEPNFDSPACGFLIKPAVPTDKLSKFNPVSLDDNVRALHDSREEVCNRVGIQSLAVMHSAACLVDTVKVPSHDSKFIIGTEQGEVYTTLLDFPRVKPDKFAFKSVKVGTSGTHKHENHYGPVQVCASSPFERNLFLTASSDGSVKLRNLLENTLLTLEPSVSAEDYIYCAEFSPFRPCVVAIGMRAGQLAIFDIEQSTVRPTTVDAGDSSPVLSVAFNKNNADLLATGDAKGQVKVWQLPHFLSRASKKEQEMLSLPASKDDKKKECWMRMTGMVL
eukprot:TRINITY_DN17358_c0_g1_i1.p1 TRINITY_DN17358_c0_g1~~TRINITY_DN17358_c0_g1_i1.p1  ORF type:complete len:574 (+),score=191.84 TRINITY_DN17358_c0_g1_i1:69-1790(+)